MITFVPHPGRTFRLFLIFFFLSLVIGSSSVHAGTVRRVYTSSGSWTAPPGITSVDVEVWGGGGAGAGNTTTSVEGEAGGGGGAYSRKTVSVTPGNSYSFTVGSAGTGSAAAGGDGGDTYFIDTATVMAKGGRGGSGDTGGSGGLASQGVGDVRFNGGAGGAAGGAVYGSGGGGGSAGDASDGGPGGAGTNGPVAGTAGAAGTVGGGAGGAGLAAESDGLSGSFPGGGGSGAYVADATDHSGGAGSAGLVVISYSVTGAVPSLVGVGAQVSGTTSPLVPPLPSGLQSGDVLVLIITGRPSGTAGTADAITPPLGWTQRGTRIRYEMGTVDLSIDVWWKVAGYSNTDPSITAGTAFTGGNTEGWSAQVAAYRNVDTVNPFDLTSPGTAGAAASATLTPPSITTNIDHSMAVSIVVSADDNALGLSTANLFTGEMTGANYDTTNGSDMAMGLADLVTDSAGSITMPTWQQTLNGNDAWAYFSDALRPRQEVVGVRPVSAGYMLYAYQFGSGGEDEISSAAFSLNGLTGQVEFGKPASSNYYAGSGLSYTQTSSVPSALVVTNPTGSYHSLHLVLDTTGNPSDARYAIAASPDAFVSTTRYVQADYTLGPDPYWQTSASWGSTGFNVIGLLQSTTYSFKVSAMHGEYSQSGFSPVSQAATDVATFSFDLTPNSVSLGALSPGTVVTSGTEVMASISTNIAGGGVVYVYDQNSGLLSSSTGYNIAAGTLDLATSGEGYGIRGTSVSQTLGGPLRILSPYNGIGSNVGALNTTRQPLFDTSGAAVTGGQGLFEIKAKASSTTTAAADYSDILTIVAAATF